jgi:mono/diheme cytochrome c family protein
MAGSENHLRIFTAKLKDKAVEYKPQYLSQQDYNQIIAAVTTENTTTTTTTSTSQEITFNKLAANGKQSYGGNCINCHGESMSAGSASSVTLSKYQNAQKLLEKISMMPTSGVQDQWEVLSYLLLEHGWVSGNTIFNPDTLSQIALSP